MAYTSHPCRNDQESYFKEVEEIRQKENIPLSKQEQYKYASCKWCFDKIREGGGLSIYCHPYWVFENRYNVSLNLHNYIYHKQPFDAYEIIGDSIFMKQNPIFYR